MACPCKKRCVGMPTNVFMSTLDLHTCVEKAQHIPQTFKCRVQGAASEDIRLQTSPPDQMWMSSETECMPKAQLYHPRIYYTVCNAHVLYCRLDCISTACFCDLYYYSKRPLDVLAATIFLKYTLRMLKSCLYIKLLKTPIASTTSYRLFLMT